MTSLNDTLGVVYIFGSLILFWAMAKVTADFGWHSKRAIWSWLRRLVYGVTSVALFGLGLKQFGYHHPLLDCAFNIIVVANVLVFPMLRVFGWITQDELTEPRLDRGRHRQV